MASRSDSGGPISTYGGRKRLTGCMRYFVALFLSAWGLGFAGAGVALLGDGTDTHTGRLLLAVALFGLGGAALLFGLALAFTRRLPWPRRRVVPTPATGTASAPSRDPATALGPRTLRPASRRGCAVIFLVPFTLVWGGVVVFMFRLAEGPGGPPMFMVVAFGLLGVVLIGATVRALLALTNPSAEVDVERAEISIGDEIRLPWRLVGSTARLTTLTVELLGREEASYTRGTDRVTETHEFHRQTLLEHVSTSMSAGGTLSFRLPPGAVPSFEARSNKVRWFVRFQAPIRRWPDVADEIELPIGPGDPDDGARRST